MYRIIALLIALTSILSACDVTTPRLAPDVAQPKTRPARNFTSFNMALRCVDELLAKQNQRTVFLSSTGIPDHTRSVSVGGDDMLINALNRMTQQSKAYVFLDQGLVKATGLIDLVVVQPKNPPRPDFYIRGSISQLDSNVVANNISVDGVQQIEENATTSAISNSRGLSVVSVDLHLVGYPNRQVVPGGSVSNSMVVRKSGRGLGAYGLISMTGIAIELRMDRVESVGQAVRSLIEVSLIELIGRHAGVPYWQCLSNENTSARKNSTRERNYTAQVELQRTIEVQRHLTQLGLFSGKIDGLLSQTTRDAIARYQVSRGLLVNGTADYDTVDHLRADIKERERTALSKTKVVSAKTKTKTAKQLQPVPRSTTQASTQPNSGTKAIEDDDWRELLPASEQRSKVRERSESSFSPITDFLE